MRVIIPRPKKEEKKKREVLDVLDALGIVNWHGERVILCFEDDVSLKKLERTYPELRKLLTPP